MKLRHFGSVLLFAVAIFLTACKPPPVPGPIQPPAPPGTLAPHGE